jgi:condensin complex subunit 2
MELELAIDPLFKKASADFDEGGAKGLLLNHLAIDSSGRIVFDSSDDAQDPAIGQTEIEAEEVSTSDIQSKPNSLDLQTLGLKFLPDLSLLDAQDICPSLKNFELGSGDSTLDLPFLKAPEYWKQESKDDVDTPDATANPALAGFDDDDNLLGGMELADDIGFGEGGEVWAKEVALEPQLRLHQSHDEGYGSDVDGKDESDDIQGTHYTLSMKHGAVDEQQNILDYFDKALRSNWAGPEHWKIRKVKENAKPSSQIPTKRKERELFEIDFQAPMSQQLADALYTPVSASSAITLPKAQWRSKTRNLLPDDKHFSSRQLLRLFLKPNAHFGRRAAGGSKKVVTEPNGLDIGEEYWAQRQGEGEALNQEGEEGQQANYNADFFQDDGFNLPGADDDDDEFADARDHFSPEADGPPAEGEVAGTQGGAFGAQIVTQSRRLRPEYVQYARVAKKVDVRRLKEEIWKGLAFEKV